MAIEENKERAAKLRALERSTIKHGAILGLQTFGLLAVANICVVVIDALNTHSQAFCILGGAMNGFFIFRWMGRQVRKEHDRVKEEVKKIFENKT
jgi:hypothetical protein